MAGRYVFHRTLAHYDFAGLYASLGGYGFRDAPDCLEHIGKVAKTSVRYSASS